jgi:U3 small nucleolar RNA-associated protein 10
MSVLSTLLDKRQSIKEGIDYVEQEVLGAILALLERTNDAAELRGGVGIEVIVKVIRGESIHGIDP